MNNLEAKAEEIRQMLLKLDEWYGPEDYLAIFKGIHDGHWMAALTAVDGTSLWFPGTDTWAESEWKPTAIEALESLYEKLQPYAGDESDA